MNFSATVCPQFLRLGSSRLAAALLGSCILAAACSTEKSASPSPGPSTQNGAPSGASANAIAQTTTAPGATSAAGAGGNAAGTTLATGASTSAATSPATLAAPSTPAGATTANSFINSLIAAFGGGGAATSGSSSGAGAIGVGNATTLTAAQLTELRQACLNSINQYRATIGKSALTLNTGEASCLDGQAQGDGGGVVAHAHFGACQEEAQDECPGWSGDPGAQQTACLASMWAEGPGGGHYENMSGNYTSVQCGFAQGNGGWWMVQDFFP